MARLNLSLGLTDGSTDSTVACIALDCNDDKRLLYSPLKRFPEIWSDCTLGLADGSTDSTVAGIALCWCQYFFLTKENLLHLSFNEAKVE